MSEHTKGRLHVAENCSHKRAIFSERDLLAVAEMVSLNNPEQERANARRLVACWNACQGISTGDIEHGVVPPVDKRIYARIESARDELIEALREIVSDASDRIAVCPITLAKARAILAKHAKGEA